MRHRGCESAFCPLFRWGDVLAQIRFRKLRERGGWRKEGVDGRRLEPAVDVVRNEQDVVLSV